MVIYIGADHRGFELKGKIKDFLKSRGYQLVDMGDEKYDESDDYPLFAIKVAKQVSQEFETARGYPDLRFRHRGERGGEQISAHPVGFCIHAGPGL